MITRPDRKIARESNVSIESVRDDNIKLNRRIMEQLNVQPDVFIDYLRGKDTEVE